MNMSAQNKKVAYEFGHDLLLNMNQFYFYRDAPHSPLFLWKNDLRLSPDFNLFRAPKPFPR